MPGARDRNTPKARLLGAELRSLREQAKWSGRKLASELGIAQGTVSRYERGERTPSVAHVARVLGVLGVTGAKYDEIIGFAETASEPNLVADSRSGMHAHLIELAEYDRAATRITHVAPLVVPGPFQTRAYAREIMSSVPPDERDVRVEMRMARREALRSEREFTVLIAERVLRETMGSDAVMREQLQHLAELAEWPNITIRVIPASVHTWTLAHNGSFVLFEFAKAAPTVHLEHFRGPVFLYDADDVEAYRDALVTLSMATISPDKSAGLIADIAEQLERAQS
ncbi:helix-turn-helix transcriptional regulator [Saccharopolyspora hirsuta]|uniref:helix-turn-helix domain-containing protein n=1 Tax=Saccharopolyspora hirsuta TaxID=1837 RepID=UPI0033336373